MLSLAVAFLLAAVAPGLDTGCQPRKLTPEAVRLVEPLLSATVRSRENKRDHQAAAIRRERLAAVLADRTHAGDEALAYLLTLYLGEGPGEELVCEAVNRGPRIAPLIREFAACQPLSGLEPLDASLAGSGRLPGYALGGIDQGKPCEYEK